jgi:hypothetical protein
MSGNSQPLLPEARLRDPRYRAELLGKIEALLSVLELAHRKVVANLALPGCDNRPRLSRTRVDIEATLEILRRARATLRGEAVAVADGADSAAEAAFATGPAGRPLPARRRMSRREYSECASLEEYRLHLARGPLRPVALSDAELEELCSQLAAWPAR